MAGNEENKQNDVVAIELPAPAGWIKKFTPPKKGGTPRRNDIVFVSPTGEEIKNKRQLEQYLKSHTGEPAVSEFIWGVGDTPRRSARLSDKPKVLESEPPKKKPKQSSSKKKVEQEKNTAADGEDNKDATAEETKQSADEDKKDSTAEETKQSADEDKKDSTAEETKESADVSMANAEDSKDTNTQGTLLPIETLKHATTENNADDKVEEFKDATTEVLGVEIEDFKDANGEKEIPDENLDEGSSKEKRPVENEPVNPCIRDSDLF